MNALLASDAPLGTASPLPYFYLAYSSQLGKKSIFGKTIFTDICHTASQNNRSAQITGFLFFKKGYFFQYLEGDESQVRALYQTISQDQRHKRLRILREGYHEARLFPIWAMHCFKSGDDDEAEVMSGYLQDFAVDTWDGEIAYEVVMAVKAYYQSNPNGMQHQPFSNSYLGEQVGTVAKQHSSFIVLQLAFMVMALLMVAYWLCFG